MIVFKAMELLNEVKKNAPRYTSDNDTINTLQNVLNRFLSIVGQDEIDYAIETYKNN